jgi:hypothetical protein
MIARFEILTDQTPYLLIKVMFEELNFEQWIITEKTGVELNNQLQAYADEYMTEWVANSV